MKKDIKKLIKNKIKKSLMVYMLYYGNEFMPTFWGKSESMVWISFLFKLRETPPLSFIPFDYHERIEELKKDGFSVVKVKIVEVK